MVRSRGAKILILSLLLAGGCGSGSGGSTGATPVTGVLCFIDADWPLFETMFTLRDVYVASPRRLTKLITNDTGGIDPARTAAYLAERFPAA